MTITTINVKIPLSSLGQASSLIDGLEAMVSDLTFVTTLPAQAYQAKYDGQSSIGAHVRHVLEFLQVLTCNLDGGVIDYESRDHNPAYESDPRMVATMLPQLKQQLAHALVTQGSHHPLVLHETVVTGGEKVTTTTSLGREILFILQHGVHHLAIIKMQAAAMNVAIPSACGVAVATLAYRDKLYG